jgi:hypothetical protein
MEETQNSAHSNESLAAIPIVYQRLLVDPLNKTEEPIDVVTNDKRPAPVFEPLNALSEEGNWHTKPLLDDAFALLNDNVRAAHEEFQTLFGMLKPHLRLLATDNYVKPAAPGSRDAEADPHSPHLREYSPTYLKVIEAAETIHAMRRDLHQIVNHLIV